MDLKTRGCDDVDEAPAPTEDNLSYLRRYGEVPRMMLHGGGGERAPIADPDEDEESISILND